MKFKSRDELEAWREYVLTMLNRGDFWEDVHHRADRFIEMERERSAERKDGEYQNGDPVMALTPQPAGGWEWEPRTYSEQAWRGHWRINAMRKPNAEELEKYFGKEIPK